MSASAPFPSADGNDAPVPVDYSSGIANLPNQVRGAAASAAR
jgi:hypothetical protein